MHKVNELGESCCGKPEKKLPQYRGRVSGQRLALGWVSITHRWSHSVWQGMCRTQSMQPTWTLQYPVSSVGRILSIPPTEGWIVMELYSEGIIFGRYAAFSHRVNLGVIKWKLDAKGIYGFILQLSVQEAGKLYSKETSYLPIPMVQEGCRESRTPQ